MVTVWASLRLQSSILHSQPNDRKSSDMSERPVVAPVRDSALWTMVKIRLLEFTRKPEAIFWTYFFPLIMVAILGSAFRSQPEENRILVFRGRPAG